MKTTYKTLTNEEYNVLNKIAYKTKIDCWFCIKQDNKGTDYVYDLEENKRICLKTGVSQLIEGVDCIENYNACELSNNETYILKELLKKLNIKVWF